MLFCLSVFESPRTFHTKNAKSNDFTNNRVYCRMISPAFQNKTRWWWVVEARAGHHQGGLTAPGSRKGWSGAGDDQDVHLLFHLVGSGSWRSKHPWMNAMMTKYLLPIDLAPICCFNPWKLSKLRLASGSTWLRRAGLCHHMNFYHSYSSRYYNKKLVEDQGCKYVQLPCKGHGESPDPDVVSAFIRICRWAWHNI